VPEPNGRSQDGRPTDGQSEGQGPPQTGVGAGSGEGSRPPAGVPATGKKIDTLVRGQKGKGPELITPFRGAPDRSDSQIPSYAVTPAALRQAEDALAKEEVPAAYRKSVKQYFEGIR
jgi:hypothetical protein